jgi:hypothetical protein
MTEACFYQPLGPGRYHATRATVGPWDPHTQHGGPPSALLAAELERAAGDPSLRIARFGVDFLGPIAQGEVAVEARVLRPGRRVQLVEATMAVGGRQVAVDRAWRYGQGHATPPAGEQPAPPPLPEPGPVRYFPGLYDGQYGGAIDWRFVRGSMVELGPSQVRARPRIPLVEGRETAPFEDLLVVADSANGLSFELAVEEWMSIPTALTVTLARHPSSGWVFLDSRTTLAGDGVGLTVGEMADESGFLGTLAQPLTVAAR